MKGMLFTAAVLGAGFLTYAAMNLFRRDEDEESKGIQSS